MKMAGGAAKTLAALIVAFVAYIDKTLSPLFWVLLVLIAVDLLLNIHQEGKQLQKLGAAFFALGIPSFVSQHLGPNMMAPEILKVIVALLVIGYIQVDGPLIVAFFKRAKLSPDPAVNVVDHTKVDPIVQAVLAALDAKAQAQAAAQAKQVGTGGQ